MLRHGVANRSLHLEEQVSQLDRGSMPSRQDRQYSSFTQRYLGGIGRLNMHTLLLSAGFGTRLQPLTNFLP